MIELASPDESNQPTGRFGAGVNALSDLTGDGIGELAVATTETTDGIMAVGSVYILNGRDFSVVRRFVSPEPTFSGNFGYSQPFLASYILEVPDLNGDEVPEFIIPTGRSGAPRTGKDRVYVFSGASGVLLQTLFSPDGDVGSWFGAAVATLRTTRSNSVPTIVVSSPGADEGTPTGFGQGTAARIHFFNPVSGQVRFTIKKPDDKRWFGASLAAIGDVDADGRDDLAVGAGPAVSPPNFGSSPPTGAGAAYILSGETGRVLHELNPPLPANVTFRWAVAAVPDVNADGKTDVLVGIGGGARAGAPTRSGHAYVFSGGDGKLLRSLISPNETEHGGFGWSVAGVPDVTGDGAGELLIGAAEAGRGSGAYGERRMYLIDGGNGRTIQAFASPYESESFEGGESMGWDIAVLLGKDGKLRNLIAGVRREASLRGRVFAFPLRFLTAARSAEGMRVSLTATDDKIYILQTSPDLKTWTTLAPLQPGPMPVTFVDKAANGIDRRFYRAQQD